MPPAIEVGGPNILCLANSKGKFFWRWPLPWLSACSKLGLWETATILSKTRNRLNLVEIYIWTLELGNRVSCGQNPDFTEELLEQCQSPSLLFSQRRSVLFSPLPTNCQTDSSVSLVFVFLATSFFWDFLDTLPQGCVPNNLRAPHHSSVIPYSHCLSVCLPS